MTAPDQACAEEGARLKYQSHFKAFCDTRYAGLSEDTRSIVTEGKLHDWLKDGLLVGKESSTLMTNQTADRLSLEETVLARSSIVDLWDEQVAAQTNSHPHPSPLSDPTVRLIKEVYAEELAKYASHSADESETDSDARRSSSPAGSASDSTTSQMFALVKTAAADYRSPQYSFLEFCRNHFTELSYKERFLVTENKVFKWMTEEVARRRNGNYRNSFIKGPLLSASSLSNARYAVANLWKLQVDRGWNPYPKPASARLTALIDRRRRKKASSNPDGSSSSESDESPGPSMPSKPSNLSEESGQSRVSISQSADVPSKLPGRSVYDELKDLQESIHIMRQQLASYEKQTQDALAALHKSQTQTVYVMQTAANMLRGDLPQRADVIEQMRLRLTSELESLAAGLATTADTLQHSASYDLEKAPRGERSLVNPDISAPTQSMESSLLATSPSCKRVRELDNDLASQTKRLTGTELDGCATSEDFSQQVSSDAYRAALQGALSDG